MGSKNAHRCTQNADNGFEFLVLYLSILLHCGVTYSLFLPSIMQQINNTDSHLIHKMVIKCVKVIKIIKILNIYALSQCYMFRPYKAIFRLHFYKESNALHTNHHSFSYVVFFISFLEMWLFLSLVCYFLDVCIKCPFAFSALLTAHRRLLSQKLLYIPKGCNSYSI
jgi:hypothetical protein